MERSTGNTGGLGVGAGVLLLDQFEAIFRKTREIITQYPQATGPVVAAAVAQAKWCYETTLFTGNAPGIGLQPDMISRLLEIPVPSAVQRQNAANLERQREHA